MYISHVRKLNMYDIHMKHTIIGRYNTIDILNSTDTCEVCEPNQCMICQKLEVFMSVLHIHLNVQSYSKRHHFYGFME